MRRPPRRAGYFIRQTLHTGDKEFFGGGYYRDHMLVELTHTELREINAAYGPPTVRYKPVHWTNAHDWVRRGRIHGTGLWTDNGRIRYAEGEVVD